MYKAQIQSEWIQASLDHIYISRKAKPFTFDWEIKISAIPTDHAMVSVRYAPKEAPHIGKGRWTLPPSLIYNKKFLEKVAEEGIALQAQATRDQIERTDRQTANIQKCWETYKESAHKITKGITKEYCYKINLCIKAIKKDLKETNNILDISTNR